MFLSSVRICVLFRKARRWRLPENGIRFSSQAPVLVVRQALSEGLWRCVSDGFRGIRSAFIFSGSSWVRFYKLDPFDLCFSSSATAIALQVRQSCGSLARWFPDYLLQQDLPGSGERGAIIAGHIRIAPVLLVVARRSTKMDVIFVTSSVLYLNSWWIEREFSRIFFLVQSSFSS